jgi:HSP20 family molecular chaperone IbpA
MKRVQARIEENRKEHPSSEPDHDPNAWLIEARLKEDIPNWQNVRLQFESPGVEAEVLEVSMSDSNWFTVRTEGKSPLKRGDIIQVQVWEENPI